MLSLSLRARGLRADVDSLRIAEERARALEPDASFERLGEGGATTLAITLHPAAGPVELTQEGETLRLEASTGSAGPGYHAAVCELADAIAAALSVRWRAELDPALYFAHRDAAALERAQLTWLGQTAREILGLAREGASGFALCMPDGLEVAHDGLVATPLGPRDRAWVERVAADPRAGIDAFAWWHPGRDAAYHRGVALSLMWLEVRWRKPIDARERALLDRVATALERAHAAEPDAAYPWSAWSELFELSGEESLRATRAPLKALEVGRRDVVRIGYRRLAVRVTLSGGWSIAVPGELAERWDERGTWVGWDARRSLWITTAEAPPGHDTAQTLEGLPPLEGDGDVLAMERGPIRGAVRFGIREDGEGPRSHVAQAQAALGRHVVLGTFVGSREEDRDAFLEMWGSLDHPDAAG
ncbi:MAG: hypothetical protein OHK0013_05140 [Sandaracinaceae bacterium]